MPDEVIWREGEGIYIQLAPREHANMRDDKLVADLEKGKCSKVGVAKLVLVLHTEVDVLMLSEADIFQWITKPTEDFRECPIPFRHLIEGNFRRLRRLSWHIEIPVREIRIDS